ncbi:hypothetical protein [Roseateles sp. BYS87W]|uniref:Uncharacterized protein n=1 Tax=Pelomonas baiyunensis TaxID=3299026 RepID=A0ABW7GWM1_9BURK
MTHWVFESFPGQIRACGGDGRVLMQFGTGPEFGARLAEAFQAPRDADAGASLGAMRPLWPAC